VPSARREATTSADKAGRPRHHRQGQVQDALQRIGPSSRPPRIVVVNTRAGLRYGNDEHVNSVRHGRRSHPFLLEKGIRLPGTGRLELGAPYISPPRNGRRPRTRRSSGKAQRPAAKSAIATSRSCKISRRCPATASPYPASAHDPRRLRRLDARVGDLRGIGAAGRGSASVEVHSTPSVGA